MVGGTLLVAIESDFLTCSVVVSVKSKKALKYGRNLSKELRDSFLEQGWGVARPASRV
jgi:hypothetical protein